MRSSEVSELCREAKSFIGQIGSIRLRKPVSRYGQQQTVMRHVIAVTPEPFSVVRMDETSSESSYTGKVVKAPPYKSDDLISTLASRYEIIHKNTKGRRVRPSEVRDLCREAQQFMQMLS